MTIRGMLVFSILIGTLCSLSAQEINLPADPLDGRIVFEEKQCITCHSIRGYGGTAGPDLSSEHYFGTGLELAAVLWNHTPDMNRKYRQLRMDRPRLTEKEMMDLLGFLSYLRYLGEPGSVANGKKLLSTKSCLTCHTIGEGARDGAPDFTMVPQYSAPLFMVQAMWNHGPAMQKKIETSGLSYPSLTGDDMVDIASYLNQVSTASSVTRLTPGNPKRGRTLFEEKNCTTCHIGEGKRRRIEPGRIKINLDKGVTEVASAMWNHGQAMLKLMKEMSIEWPVLKGNEMSDIIAYIYFLGFEETPGRVDDGEKVFRQKGCIDCHKTSGTPGVDLAAATALHTPFSMVQLMWNHAVEMEDLLITQNKRWPELSAHEMRDLFSYLQSKAKK